jgi:hypothetical protein
MPVLALATPWYTIGAAAITALLALVGVLITLIVNGQRAERQRRRDLHARALSAITAYGEMPYRIRRRAAGAEARARLSDELSIVKAEMDTYQVLLAADGDNKLSRAYDELYDTARRTAGTEAHEAWQAPLLTDDSEMNMGDLFRRLKPFTDARTEFADDLRTATLPRRKKIRRAIARRARALLSRRSSHSDEPKTAPPPQDLAGGDGPSDQPAD